MVATLLITLGEKLKSKDSEHGIKESKEMLVGMNELNLLLIHGFKDGVQFSDFPSFYQSITSRPEIQEKMKAAYDGYAKIPAEIKDIDAGEGMELAAVQVAYVPKIKDVLADDKASS